MKATLATAIVAEGASVDHFTGRVTAFNMLESVYAARLPAALPRLMVIAIYDLGDETCEIRERVRIVDDEGTDVAKPSETMLTLVPRASESELVAHSSLHAMWLVHFRKQCDHRVVVEHADSGSQDFHEVASRRIAVVQQAHPLMQPESEGKPTEPDPSPSNASGELR